MATEKQSIFKDKLKKHMVMGGGIGTAVGAVTGSVSGVGHTLDDELEKSGVKSHLKKNWKKYALGAGALVGGKYTYDQMDENGDMIEYYRDLKKKTGAAVSLGNMKTTPKYNKHVSEQGLSVQDIMSGDNPKLKAYREKLANEKQGKSK